MDTVSLSTRPIDFEDADIFQKMSDEYGLAGDSPTLAEVVSFCVPEQATEPSPGTIGYQRSGGLVPKSLFRSSTSVSKDWRA